MYKKVLPFIFLLSTFYLQPSFANDITGNDHQDITITDGAGNNDPPVESPLKSFLLAISMIVVSEIGDKTFLIAVLMAMRNSRWTVFFASSSSLVIMTVLSGILGHSITTLISERLVTLIGALSFFFFGYATLKEALQMSNSTGVEETMAEVEEEIAVRDLNKTLNSSENGGDVQKHKIAASSSYSFNKFTEQFTDFLSYIFSPVFLQVFVMVFLGEIGDRSQISIIIMGSTSNYWLCILGACIGHILCTAVAVIGGNLLASKVSMKTVSLAGAIIFFLFGLVYLANFFRS
ncbi:related to GCR1-dependent translation factor 1 [Saccharomycodes ludwigii]|uniref:GDT1 family protein n=2 Tax=Saccharomycodes ludwigii TaxID=36035 RepID=A0A376B4H7_9ASCO|nr:related to GCR1-dependent translation factor 1 [Saccharomycodes ludwigii]